MSGIGVILDLLKKNPNFYSKHSLHSFGTFSAKVAVSGAAASVLTSYPFGFRAFLGSNNRIAYCDTAATWNEDNFSKDHDEHVSEDYDVAKDVFEPNSLSSSGKDVLEPHSLSYSGKVYNVELKSLFSAFHVRTFGLTALRSFLMFYLPLLEPRAALEDDDEDFLADNSEARPVDLITPFHKSVKQTIRESTVITTRRVLEKLVVSYFSQRMAWKLLKDAPKSAMRKAQRGMPTTAYMCAVTKTTFRGEFSGPKSFTYVGFLGVSIESLLKFFACGWIHFSVGAAHCLGVAASWIVQVGIDIYKTLSRLLTSKEDIEEANITEEFWVLGRKIYAVTIKCSSSLVFAAIGAGIGSTLIRPSLGQWIGCAAGDLAGPVIVGICFDKLLSTGA